MNKTMETADSRGRDHPILMITGVSLVLLLTIGVISLLQTVTVTTPTGRSTTISVAGSCSTLVRPSNASGTTDVYQMAPGSTGLICVSYAFQRAGSYSFSTADYGPWLSASSYYACGYGNENVSSRCSAVTITPSISEFTHPAGQNVTVEYGIETNQNASGVFWFFVGPCLPIVLVFGPIPASVPGTGIFGCVMSTDAPSSFGVIGVWNMNIVAVPVG
jgi:hypothetical protein